MSQNEHSCARLRADIFPTVLGSVLGSWVVQSCDCVYLVFLRCRQTAFRMMPFWILWQCVSSRSPGFSLAFGQLSGAVLVCRWWGRGLIQLEFAFLYEEQCLLGVWVHSLTPTYLCWSVHFKSFALLAVGGCKNYDHCRSPLYALSGASWQVCITGLVFCPFPFHFHSGLSKTL